MQSLSFVCALSATVACLKGKFMVIVMRRLLMFSAINIQPIFSMTHMLIVVEASTLSLTASFAQQYVMRHTLE